MKLKSLIQKLLICLIAGLVCGETFLRIGDKFLSFFLPVKVVIALSVFILVGSLIYAFIWQHKDQKGKTKNSNVRAFWIGAIRYGLAFDLVAFGFQKIFHLQLNTPMGMLDEPFSSFSSQALTWAYFGHSYGYACTLGIAQILGSLLLVFNRTRLLGVIVLLPVMVNIVFIDYFYELDPGVLTHAVILLAGLIYLLMIDFHRLNDFFLRFEAKDMSVRTSGPVIKFIGRLSILFVPLLLIWIKGSPDHHPAVTGKYVVTEMKINGKPSGVTSCSDSLLTLVYLDIANDCVFEFNGQHRRMFGSYSLDESNGRVSTSWHYPPAAKEKIFDGILERKSENEIALNGRIEKDSIQVKLVRQ